MPQPLRLYALSTFRLALRFLPGLLLVALGASCSPGPKNSGAATPVNSSSAPESPDSSPDDPVTLAPAPVATPATSPTPNPDLPAQVMAKAEYTSLVQKSLVNNSLAQNLAQIPLAPFAFTVPAFDLDTTPKVHVGDVQVKVTSLNPQYSSNDTGVLFLSTQNRVDLEISSISLNMTSTQTVDGVTATVTINASCTGVQATILDDSSILRAQIQPVVMGTKLTATVGRPFAQVGNPSLSFNAMNCVGAKGFDDLVKSQAQKSLADLTDLNRQINTELAQEISKLNLSQAQMDWTTPQTLMSMPQFSLVLVPESLATDSSGNWISGGHIEVRVSSLASLGITDPQAPARMIPLPTQNLGDQGNLMVVPEELWTLLAQINMAPINWSMDSDTNAMKGFSALMSSRFKQLAVWPDLAFFSKTSDFQFHVVTTAMPDLVWTGDDQMQLQASFLAQMKSPGDTGHSQVYQPYVDFTLTSSMALQLTLTPSEVTAIGQKNPKTSLSYSWTAPFCHQPPPDPDDDGGNRGPNRCGHISTKDLLPPINSFLTGQKMSFPLPQAASLGGIALNLQNVVHDFAEHVVTMSFSPVTTNPDSSDSQASLSLTK